MFSNPPFLLGSKYANTCSQMFSAVLHHCQFIRKYICFNNNFLLNLTLSCNGFLLLRCLNASTFYCLSMSCLNLLQWVALSYLNINLVMSSHKSGAANCIYRITLIEGKIWFFGKHWIYNHWAFWAKFGILFNLWCCL